MQKEGQRGVESGTKTEKNKHKMLAVEERKKGIRRQEEMRHRQFVRRMRQSMFKGILRLYCYQEFDLKAILLPKQNKMESCVELNHSVLR